MKAVILAGGMGTRISDNPEKMPKPMVSIGGKPILWHIMSIYSHHGINEFIICCGFRGHLIKEYFYHYHMHSSNMEIDLASNSVRWLGHSAESWKVSVMDTGLDVMTAGRISQIRHLVEGETFLLTYGDGVGDVDIPKTIETHSRSGKAVTLTAVHSKSRFGNIVFDGDSIESFAEKPAEWINGGFFVVSPEALSEVTGDPSQTWEEVLGSLASKDQLGAHRHQGFWQAMDTMADRSVLESLWTEGRAPWKVWS